MRTEVLQMRCRLLSDGRGSMLRRGLLLAGLFGLLPGCGLKLPFLSFRPGGDVILAGIVADRSVAAGDSPYEIINPLGPYEPLRAALQAELDRPVVLDLCLRLALEPYLRDGHYDIALLSPAEYASLPKRERFEILAVSTDAQDRPARDALLVVSATSPVQSVAELKGKQVAFGLARDARTHQAGLDLLSSHGVDKSQLALDPLPIPGSLRTFPKSRDVMRSVLLGSADAGFVDSAAWDELPERASPGQPTRDRMRIIGRTAAVPDLVVVASAKLESDLRARLVAALGQVTRRHSGAVRALGLRGFAAPPAEALQALEQLGRPGGA